MGRMWVFARKEEHSTLCQLRVLLRTGCLGQGVRLARQQTIVGQSDPGLKKAAPKAVSMTEANPKARQQYRAPLQKAPPLLAKRALPRPEKTWLAR